MAETPGGKAFNVEKHQGERKEQVCGDATVKERPHNDDSTNVIIGEEGMACPQTHEVQREPCC